MTDKQKLKLAISWIQELHGALIEHRLLRTAKSAEVILKKLKGEK